MVERWLVDTPWLAAAVWAALFVSDYFLTLYGARLYAANGVRHFDFEGSYELTPQFQTDIDRQRKFSRRFWIAFLAGVVGLNAYWYLAVKAAGDPGLYLIVAGALLLVQVAIHLRHLRNITTFRLYAVPGLISGKVTYSRSLVLRQSAYDILFIAGLYAVIAVITFNHLVVGGVIGCLVLAGRHFLSARRHGRKPLRDTVAV